MPTERQVALAHRDTAIISRCYLRVRPESAARAADRNIPKLCSEAETAESGSSFR